jgi:tetratricopeptide (TPR) repeat protein
MTHLKRPGILGIAILFVIVAVCGSCSRSPYVIPELETAAQQYRFAQNQEQNYLSALNKNKHDENSKKAIHAFEVVMKRFPDDKVFYPQSQYRIAFILDKEKKTNAALKMYNMLIKNYPDNPQILASSLYGAAVIYDGKKKFEKAQTYYERIIKEFGNNKEFERLVLASKNRYTRVREK